MKRGLSKFQLTILLSVILIISVGFIMVGRAQDVSCNNGEIEKCPSQLSVCERVCSNGQWSSCQQRTGYEFPREESCLDGIDNDCNGQVDGIDPNCATMPIYRCLLSTGDHMMVSEQNECEINNGEIEGGVFGYVYLTEQPDTIPVYRCLLPGGDHMMTKDQTECSGKGGEIEGGVFGYVYLTEQPDTIPTYRCYFAVKNDHFISKDPEECGGVLNIGYEGLFGYILTKQPPTVQSIVETQQNLCRLQVTNECQEEVPGKVAGDGKDVVISCPSIDGFQYVATGIKIIDFNNIATMKPDKYKIKCCKLACV